MKQLSQIFYDQDFDILSFGSIVHIVISFDVNFWKYSSESAFTIQSHLKTYFCIPEQVCTRAEEN